MWDEMNQRPGKYSMRVQVADMSRVWVDKELEGVNAKEEADEALRLPEEQYRELKGSSSKN